MDKQSLKNLLGSDYNDSLQDNITRFVIINYFAFAGVGKNTPWFRLKMVLPIELIDMIIGYLGNPRDHLKMEMQ